MSKSLGNSLQVSEILRRVRGIELRWYLGSAHYRSMLEFSFAALDESAIAFRRIESFLNRAATFGEIGREIDPRVKAALDDDLAVPEVLALISEWLRSGNSALSAGADALGFAAKIRGALDILGCDPFDTAFGGRPKKELTAAVDGLIALLLEQREAARLRKDFAAADAIRDRITGLGITIEDTATGPRWSVN